MQVDQALLLKVAKNAKLDLTAAELKEFTPQLKEILTAFSQLDKVDTTNIKASIHPVDVQTTVREDEPRPSVPQERILANTTHKKNGYFTGPKAL